MSYCYVAVAFNLSTDKHFWYELPPGMIASIMLGQRVLVPFHNRHVVGFVVAQSAKKPAVATKRVIELVDEYSPFSAALWELLSWLARYYYCSLGQALHAAYPFRYPVKKPVETHSLHTGTRETSPGQKQRVFLHSGNVDEYIVAHVREVISQGCTAVVLVPEINSVSRVYTTMQEVGIPAITYHSQLSPRERYQRWNAMREASSLVAIGTRSLVFAPLHRLGLVVMENEEDGGYKQLEAPRYHARDVCLKRSELEGFPVFLTSIASSAESWYRASKGDYKYTKENNLSTLAPLKVVDLQREKWDDRMLSSVLCTLLEKNLREGRRSLLFVPRKGFARFVLCRDCDQALKCSECSATLSLLSGSRLTCCSCGHESKLPQVCPQCGGPNLSAIGQGTEAIELALRGLFPDAHIERVDLDTWGTGSKQLVDDERVRDADILVGTQLALKETVLSGIDLVGVVFLDILLNLADFRAGERVYQLIRNMRYSVSRQGMVVVQTYHPDHYALRAENDSQFFDEELQLRQALGYPPFERWVRILVQGRTKRKVQEHCDDIAGELRNAGVDFLGPSPCSDAIIKSRYRYHLMVRLPSSDDCSEVVKAIHLNRKSSSIKVTIDADPLVTI